MLIDGEGNSHVAGYGDQSSRDANIITVKLIKLDSRHDDTVSGRRRRCRARQLLASAAQSRHPDVGDDDEHRRRRSPDDTACRRLIGIRRRRS